MELESDIDPAGWELGGCVDGHERARRENQTTVRSWRPKRGRNEIPSGEKEKLNVGKRERNERSGNLCP